MSQYANLIEHAGSLGIGYGVTGRADVLAEYREAKAAAIDAISALERELDEAREALKPFAAFLPEVEAFVEKAAVTPGRPPIMPATKAFKLADFRRARTALASKP